MITNIPLPLYPPQYRGLLRYSTNFTLSSTSGAVATYVFSANGLYDPDITGTGHQPAGFDQIMLSYEHYVVTGARITCIFHDVTTAVHCSTVAISATAGSTPITIGDQIIEDGTNVIDTVTGTSEKFNLKVLELNHDVRRFGGVDDLLDNNLYRGDVSSNPTEQQYFHVQCFSPELATHAVGVQVIIEYEAVFKEPRRLTESLVKMLHTAIKKTGSEHKAA
jgi:hypothetical protein